MTSWKNILLVIALCGLALWQYERASDWRTSAKKFEAELLAEKSKAQETKTNVQVVVTKAQKADKVVKEALDETPAFRDTATPVPVSNRLCEVLHCK